MSAILRELKFLFRESKAIWLQIALVMLSSYGGSIVAMIVPVGLMINNILKQKMDIAFILLVVLILFSDSNSSLYQLPGKGAKDISLVMIAAYLFTQRPGSMGKSYLVQFFPFLFVAFLGLVFVNFSLLGLQKWFSYGLMLWVIPSMALDLMKGQKAHVFLRKLVFVFFFLYLFSIIMSYIRPETYYWVGRFVGIHRSPNGVGIFCGLFIPVCVMIREKFPNIFSKKMFWFIIAVFLFAILKSGSRNALMAIGIFFFFRYINIRFFSGLMLFLIIGVSYNFLFDFIQDLIVSFGLEEEMRLDTLTYASGRIYVWEVAWVEIQNNYWLGHGFSYDEYSKWLEPYYELFPMLIHNYGNIHNSYLTLWLNTGLLGLGTFMIGLIWLIIKLQRIQPGLAPFFYSCLFMGFFESWMAASLNPYTWQLWFGLALASTLPVRAAYRMKQKIKEELPPLTVSENNAVN
jgi:O-antigen ligase